MPSLSSTLFDPQKNHLVKRDHASQQNISRSPCPPKSLRFEHKWTDFVPRLNCPEISRIEQVAPTELTYLDSPCVVLNTRCSTPESSCHDGEKALRYATASWQTMGACVSPKLFRSFMLARIHGYLLITRCVLCVYFMIFREVAHVSEQRA